MIHRRRNSPATQTQRWLLSLFAVFLVGAFASVHANDDLLNLQDVEGNWAMPNGQYNGWNHSPLDQINSENVDDLQVAWTFQTGVTDAHEAQPLVIDDTMYIITPKPNTLYALDLTDGALKWSFRPDQPELDIAIERACCGGQTRGMAFAEGKLFFNSLDGQVFAVDAENGEVVWSAQNADLDIAETMSTHPLVVHDNVIVGVMGGEFGVRGHVTAYDINTGEQKWRYYSTGPDEEMGVTDRFQPFYATDQVESPGTSTWYEDSWERGGGTIWSWFTFDPELNIFYYGTGNCGPWNPDYRRDPITAPGLDQYTNKYCASLLARDASSGELVWAYSLTPQDQWDLDEPNVNMLIDMEIDGEMRETLVRPARNGFFYVFDRATGEILIEPWTYTTVTWAHGIDMETGMPDFDMDRIVYTDQPVENVCPRIAGRNWENDSYSPQTGLVYFTARNECMDYMVVEGEYVPGEPYRLREYLGQHQGADHDWLSELQAWNPATGEKVWSEPFSRTVSDKPVFTTAGNLLFRGTDVGEFEARDAASGEVLWSFRTGSEFQASPIAYVGPDGNQYVAVVSSSAPGDQQVAADAAPDDVNRYRRAGSTLYVFGLPD